MDLKRFEWTFVDAKLDGSEDFIFRIGWVWAQSNGFEWNWIWMSMGLDGFGWTGFG